MFQSNKPPPSSGSKNKESNKPSISVCYLLYIGFLLGLFFDPEDGGDMLLRNIGRLSMEYTTLYPKI
jgi:hypothetical protein